MLVNLAYDIFMFVSAFVPNDATLILVPLLAIIAVVMMLIKVLPFVWLLMEIYLLPGIPLSKFGLRGSWVVITGASDGIGKEFAMELARQGYNIVLISRTESKLASVASAISAKYPIVRTKKLAVDFTSATEDDWNAIAKLTSPLDVAMLINNVGISHKYPEPFLKTKFSDIRNIIEVNCITTLRMTQLIVPGMMDRRRGLILNMASFAGVFPTPLLSSYAGSKAFLSTWSTALGSELSPYGITVNCVNSYLVVSEMSKIRQPTLLIPTPRLFVRDVLAKIGRGCGSQLHPYNSTPYWTHAILQFAIESTLGRYNPLLLWFNKSMHESIRFRAMKKYQSQRELKKA